MPVLWKWEPRSGKQGKNLKHISLASRSLGRDQRQRTSVRIFQLPHNPSNSVSRSGSSSDPPIQTEATKRSTNAIFLWLGKCLRGLCLLGWWMSGHWLSPSSVPPVPPIGCMARECNWAGREHGSAWKARRACLWSLWSGVIARGVNSPEF